MAGRTTSAAHARATGKGRNRHERGAAWVRSFCRAYRALDASIRLADAALRDAVASRRRARRRPVQASRDLHEAEGLLVDALARLLRAARELAETNACIGREPETARFAPELLIVATARWVELSGRLNEAADVIFALHREVLAGLETGTLVPEREPADRRRRIVLAPRPVPIRAFLLRRQPRTVDRIASLLRRRRRTPRPAALRVPRRSILGRAPPLLSIGPL